MIPLKLLRSQLMISPTANPALSAIASSVLNDKVGKCQNVLKGSLFLDLLHISEEGLCKAKALFPRV